MSHRREMARGEIEGSSGNPFQSRDGLWRPDKERRYSACLSVIGKFKRREAGEAPRVGFTLIELLIVIVVLGILAAIVVFSLTGVTGQSKAAACTSDAKTVETAVDAYQATTAAFPASSTDLTLVTGALVPPRAPDYGATGTPCLGDHRR